MIVPKAMVTVCFGGVPPPDPDPVNEALARESDMVVKEFRIPALLQLENARFANRCDVMLESGLAGANTHDSFLEAWDWCWPRGITDIGVAAGCFHLYRACKVAEKVGFNVVLVRTAFRVFDRDSHHWQTRCLLNQALREPLVHAYFWWKGWV